MLKLLLSVLLGTFMSCALAQTLRIATFNVSMEAGNYAPADSALSGNELFAQLASGKNQQINNIAHIIQIVRPDIILLNEFDYTANDEKGIKAFLTKYLNVAQDQAKAINYPYFYSAAVNTGVDSGLDLDKDGVASGKGGDAFGFGLYPGQYGMVILSRYPIDKNAVRTFQHFLWQDMPDNLMKTVKNEQGQAWYSAEAQSVLRLSSKSHWDLPIDVNGRTIHLLASHPTPPVFDGPENRNGKRNHDEVRFWNDYVDVQKASYIYDDKGLHGGLTPSSRFVILGDLNSAVDNGDSMKEAISALVYSSKVIQNIPHSEGGRLHRPTDIAASTYTADWGLRADYVLPSTYGLSLVDSGVFWPEPDSILAPLVKDRQASSDHRLVWVDVTLEQ
ncbi:endonuclease/exonuclease/phosphatase family protein [Paraglaciecola sp. 25GB23A]|uniref:endonuclease/exonuclease/phosphatase family protein n=1 Tax=Paraglaciecola sp. 25GB23A TaxID=3156068 RepID=UPI0032AF18B2